MKDIPYAEGARFNPDKGCLLGTRGAILDEIAEWINHPNGDQVPRVFFLSGVAGSGKSAIAHTIAKQFDQLGRLASSFCFDKSYQEQRPPHNLFRTMTLDIADLDHQWKISLCNSLQGKRSLRTTTAVGEQFENFILKPSDDLATAGPMVVVVDALDESGDPDARRALLDVIANKMSKLPANFRVLITSRPEKDICDRLEGRKHVFSKHMDSIGQNVNEADISLYIQTQLGDVSGLDQKWPNKGWLQLLVESADGLFQWAFTACSAIKDARGPFNAAELLEHFVSAANGLDGLYTEILRQAFDLDSPRAMDRFQLIMGRILGAMEPLTVASLAALQSEGEEAYIAKLVVQLLGSLLSGVTQENVVVQPLHTSFRDYLTTEERSAAFFVDLSPQDKHLALACWRVMKAELQFNICHLETSYLKNSDIHGLDSLIAKYISPHLSYACRFWASHAEAVLPEPETLGILKGFFDHYFLYWLEVLSLIGELPKASLALQTSIDWVKVNSFCWLLPHLLT